jgi:hypothetical protein
VFFYKIKCTYYGEVVRNINKGTKMVYYMPKKEISYPVVVSSVLAIIVLLLGVSAFISGPFPLTGEGYFNGYSGGKYLDPSRLTKARERPTIREVDKPDTNCNDDDEWLGNQDIYIKGTTYGYFIGTRHGSRFQGYTHTDYCEESQSGIRPHGRPKIVMEYACNALGEKTIEDHICTYGCLNGACCINAECSPPIIR